MGTSVTHNLVSSPDIATRNLKHPEHLLSRLTFFRHPGNAFPLVFCSVFLKQKVTTSECGEFVDCAAVLRRLVWLQGVGKTFFPSFIEI